MSVQLTETSGVRLAVEGCGHGTLHAIYASVEEACKRNDWQGIDLLIIGGDFQAVRNAYDLNCVNMPAKYRAMGDFHEYYSGQRKAPYLTIFVGGNHEASNHLFELYYGGWVAPNIYYMGAANVLKLGPIRIAGLSGIWKGYNFRKSHYERLPYNESDMTSVYHVRELDVRKLQQIRTQVDIGISHDWPKGVEWKGNWKQLFRFKRGFEEDARSGQLGSTAAKQVMDWLRPQLWFSAHLHCKYAARVNYGSEEVQKAVPNGDADKAKAKNQDEIDLDMEDGGNGQLPNPSHATSNENDLELMEDGGAMKEELNKIGTKPSGTVEIDLELEDDFDGSSTGPCKDDRQDTLIAPKDEVGAEPPSMSTEDARAALPEAFRRPRAPEPLKTPAGITNQTTDFLALDKCLPRRRFLQLLEIPSAVNVDSQRPLKLEYDPEWLAITRAFALDEPLLLGDPEARVAQQKSQTEYQEAVDKRRDWVNERISAVNLIIPEDFEVTAPVYDNGNWNLPQYSQILEYPNPQTARFCKMLEIPNPFAMSGEEAQQRLADGPRPDPDARNFAKGRGRGGFGHGQDRGRGRGRGRGGGRGRFRGR